MTTAIVALDVQARHGGFRRRPLHWVPPSLFLWSATPCTLRCRGTQVCVGSGPGQGASDGVLRVARDKKETVQRPSELWVDEDKGNHPYGWGGSERARVWHTFWPLARRSSIQTRMNHPLPR